MINVFLFISIAVLSFSAIVRANTEKVIFLGPERTRISDAHPNLQDLKLITLSPLLTTQSSVRLYLPVAFPTKDSPKGIDSWYILQDLVPRRRYEVRVCWAAIQPTEFWLSTHTFAEVFEDPILISSLASFSENRSSDEASTEKPSDFTDQTDLSSALFLHVSAAADFYTNNKTLMNDPPAVLVDLILDPFIFNILPKSLVPTVIYITILAIFSWFLSRHIYTWLAEIAQQDKAHTE